MIEDLRKRVEAIIARAREELSDPSRFGRKKTLIYGGFLAVSVVLFLLSLGGSRRYADPSMEIGSVESAAPTDMESPALPIAPRHRKPQETPATWETWGRDPFSTGRSAPAAAPGDPSSELALSGISWRGGKGIALIDDLILREGETVRGLEIVNILPGCVVLERDGRKVVLCMNGEG